MSNDVDNKVAFGGEYVPKADKVGIKLSNNRSMFAQAAATKHEFEHRAEEYVDERQERNKRGLDLVRQFIGMLQDKTLPENKSILVKDVEQDVKNKLIALAVEVNNDEVEPNEGMGSVAIISLLLKTTLLQRDAINILDYKVVQLEKKLSQTTKQTSSLDAHALSNVKTD